MVLLLSLEGLRFVFWGMLLDGGKIVPSIIGSLDPLAGQARTRVQSDYSFGAFPCSRKRTKYYYTLKSLTSILGRVWRRSHDLLGICCREIGRI